MRIRIPSEMILIATIAAFGPLPAYAQTEPTRGIVELTDGLYRAQNNLHHSIFLVTESGIALVDPINSDFSLWLKRELDERFGVPVKYVIYSHHHPDHSSGGSAFSDTAQFVGHKNMLNHLDSPEMNDVVVPNLTFSDQLTISLGGKDIELIYTGVQTHTDDMSIVRFPDARAIFVVDFVSIRRIPGWPAGSDLLEAWLNAIRVAEMLEYDLAVAAHGGVGTRADISAVRHYLEELRTEVSAGITAGESLEAMQDSIRMEPYQDWLAYEQLRRRNVEGMHWMLTN